MSESKKTILITGAAGGVGRATVKHFHEHGYRVIGVDRQKSYPEFPADGMFIQADISVPRNQRKSLSRHKQFSRSLDVLVTCRLPGTPNPLVESTVENGDIGDGFRTCDVFLGALLALPC